MAGVVLGCGLGVFFFFFFFFFCLLLDWNLVSTKVHLAVEMKCLKLTIGAFLAQKIAR